MYISSDCHNPVLSFPRILHLKFWAIVTSTPLSRPGCDIPSLKSGARASNSSAALYGTKLRECALYSTCTCLNGRLEVARKKADVHVLGTVRN
ncbi:hypothetical protein SCLCIDRAFT_1212918 [Scleroderma citrinum Foug A]|uniref:Uncharacterized protein n=1 Tax=Scleroderma citrinum Foug A TaxID=1036808 RepID=A0A0C3AIU5_9AGAM|nr:hypothetical protein SCLCIDRAFT_1212918 [Scleroderma citrinum Foug A]